MKNNTEDIRLEKKIRIRNKYNQNVFSVFFPLLIVSW